MTSSNPTSGNLKATISTIGQGGSKLITATFSLPMRATTLTSTTFTLAPVGQPALTGTVVSYDALSQVATLKTAAALLANTSYTAIITQGAVTSAGGVPLSCIFAWNFTTVAPPPALGGPVNLGMASSFGSASRAGISTTGAVSPIINGNVALINTLTCNLAAVPGGTGSAGLGVCSPNPPTLNGTAYIPGNPDATTADAVFVDLKTAYDSITTAQLPGGISLAGAVIGTGATACAGVGVGCQGNATLPPGTYVAASATSIGIDGTLTLDAGGNPDAVFIFQMGSTLTTLTSSQIVLIGGAKASNVWWQVGSSATLGVTSVFKGNVLSFVDLTINNGATSCGRVLTGANPTVGSGAITLGSGSTASVPGNVNAPAGCI